MTKDQALKFLPDMFRKLGTGQSVDSMVVAAAFVDFLYRHGFVILSQKERAKKEQAK